MKNPLPPMKDAQTSVHNLIHLQEDLLILKVEKTVATELRKMKLGIISVVFSLLAFASGIGWCLVALHENGMSSLYIALLSFLLLGAISLFYKFLFSRAIEFKGAVS